MARTAYFAPGVYVEEVPSARQPIAGVGTNTVGFIGMFDDTIRVPRSNENYDPVLAQAWVDLQNAQADPQTKDMARKQLDNARNSLKNEAGALAAQLSVNAGGPAGAQAALPKAKTEAKPGDGDDKAGGDKAGGDKAGDEKAKAAPAPVQVAQLAMVSDGPAMVRLKQKSKALNEELTDLDGRLSIRDGVFNDDVSKKSRVRPYWIDTVSIAAREFETKLCTNFSEYTALFGEYSAFEELPVDSTKDTVDWVFKPTSIGHHLLTHAVDGFFKNGGTKCFVARVGPNSDWTKVLERFESIDDVSIIAAPGVVQDDMKSVWEALEAYAEHPAHQNVFAILDPPERVGDAAGSFDIQKLAVDAEDALMPRKSTYSAYYFPYIEINDPAKRLQDSYLMRGVAAKYRGRAYVAPSGHIAGVYARTDEQRGVHKAPANAGVRGSTGVRYYISTAKQELLNPQGVNCLRIMNGEVTVWGARTVGGDRNGEFKYINVRRFMGFLEESIDQGTQWVVFEPNDPTLWSKIILNLTAFLTNVWRSGALFGLTPQEAFYVKCDEELNPASERDEGKVIAEIGVSIVRPAEFVIFRITQSVGITS